VADLRQVQDAVATLLTDIGMLFKGSPKVTLLVRHPDLEAEGKDANFVMTDDTLDQAIAALQRRAAADQPAKGSSRFDPPGLWESEPRSSADDAGTAGQ
jgi:hypothetical protein